MTSDLRFIPAARYKFFEIEEDLKTKTTGVTGDDLAMMYRGTYSSKFYKQLHRYIHKLYRREQGFKCSKRFLLVFYSRFIQGLHFHTAVFIPSSWKQFQAAVLLSSEVKISGQYFH
jgi:hypothetical protein